MLCPLNEVFSCRLKKNKGMLRWLTVMADLFFFLSNKSFCLKPTYFMYIIIFIA